MSFEFFPIRSYDRFVSQMFVPPDAVPSSGDPLPDGGAAGFILRGDQMTARVTFTRRPVTGLAGVGIVLDAGQAGMHVFLPHDRFAEWLDLLTGAQGTGLFYVTSDSTGPGGHPVVDSVRLTTEEDPLAAFAEPASADRVTALPDDLRRLLPVR